MSTSSQGSFSTFLLSLPLAGVAFMAMFGVPQFAPGMAPGNDEELVRSERRRGDRDSRADDVFHEFSESAFGEDAPQFGSPAPFRSQADNSPSAVADRRNHFAPAASPLRPNEFRLEDEAAPAFQARPVTTPVWAQSADAIPAVDTRSTMAGTQATSSTRELLDWQAASRKLNEIGIEKYHLERGEEEGSFLFVCLFTPASSPHVTRRFEAEARDPLHAVNAVLAQIDDWLKQQYAAPAAGDIRAASL